MPVPFESVLPMGIVVVFFGVAGGGMGLLKRMQNDGKPTRYMIDRWDEQMMARDERLTGHFRRQSVDPIAPPDFLIKSAWTTERR